MKTYTIFFNNEYWTSFQSTDDRTAYTHLAGYIQRNRLQSKMAGLHLRRYLRGEYRQVNQ